MTEELWEKLGYKKSIHQESWPKYNPKLIIDETYTLIIQINGKMRSQLEVNKDITQVEVESKALSDEMVKKWIGTNSIKKTIFVDGKLINFVV